MSKANVFDMICDAVEDYNNYTSRKDVTKLSYEEKRGLLYNYLRNRFSSLTSPRSEGTSIFVCDLACSFDEKGRVIWIHISKHLHPSFNFHYRGWSTDEKRCKDEMDRLRRSQEIKDVVNEIPFWYPTKALNEMSYIVNSIKIT